MYRSYAGSAADSRAASSVESQLRELTQDFAIAFNTGNFDHAAAIFANDGVLMVPCRDAAQGPKPIETSLRQFADAGYSELRLETLRVEHSGDMAMELGRFSVLLKEADGNVTPERGSFVKVWRRLGAWLVVADCWSRGTQAVREKAA